MKNKKSIKIKEPSRLLIGLAKSFFSIKLLIKKIDLEVDDSETKDISAPYIMIVNHGAHIDSFIMYHTLFPKNTPFVLGASNLMSNRLRKKLLTRGGVISKLQCRSDIKATRTMFSVVKNGYPLVLYPQGRLPSAGEGKEVDLSIAKLVKKMNVPVLGFKIEGSSLVSPKWAKKDRKGYVSVKTKVLFNKKELQDSSLEEIRDKINKDVLVYNDYDANLINNNTYISKNKALGLENILYICPKCGRKYTTYTKSNHILCSCGLDLILDKYSMFKVNPYFNHINSWFNYQLDIVNKEVSSSSYTLTSKVKLEVLVKNKLYKKNNNGIVVLDKTGLTYSGTYLKENKTFTIPISELSSLPYTCNNNFETAYNGDLIKFIPINKRSVTEFSICAEALANKGEF